MRDRDVGEEARARRRISRCVWLILSGLVVAAWVLNVSRAGTRVQGCPEGCATVGDRREGPLRVMSLNVLHDFPRFWRLSDRLERIAAEIRRHDADVVCLQEVPWTLRLRSAAAYLAERSGLNYLYLRANGNRWTLLFEEGEAILSRYPLRAVVFSELEPSAGFFEHRIVLGATAVTPWGDLPVFVTHLTNGEPEINRAQAAALVTFVAGTTERTALVAGDFNATEDSPQITAITSRWVDTYRAAHPDDTGYTCCVDDPSHGPGEPLEQRIDYVFLLPGTAPAAEVVGSQRVLDQPSHEREGWLWASDHVGLLTSISVEP